MEDKIKNKFLEILANSTFITLSISVMFYIIIASYYINFFNRLSLPFSLLELPFSFYLNAGYNLLGIIFYILCILTPFVFFFLPDKYQNFPEIERFSDRLILKFFYFGSFVIILIWLNLLYVFS